ncbi:esterase YbfF-like isoform X2 [Watersipora subatra]|uniref:esterase YbfF-like isoform X2 n=1 Tax=Watersipora subatra TaxID=2589382 RepID=UPI00355C450B
MQVQMNRLNIPGRIILLQSRLTRSARLSTVKLAYTDYQPVTKNYDRNSSFLILHGLFGSKNNWQLLGRKLADRLNTQVVAIDVRNHGDSPHSSQMTYSLMADDVIALMDSLNLKKCHLLGHSMGGRVAMNLALKMPDRLNSLIIEDVLPDQGPFSSEFFIRCMEAMLKLDMNMGGDGLAHFRQKAMKTLEKDIPGIKIREFLIQNLTKMDDDKMARWRCNVKAIQANWPEIMKGTLPNATQFNRPTCFIGGGKSPYLREGSYTEENKAVILKYFPQAECHVVPAAGHLVHSEQPDVFLERVCTFLRTML